jgi:hypothetical protein
MNKGAHPCKESQGVFHGHGASSVARDAVGVVFGCAAMAIGGVIFSLTTKEIRGIISATSLWQ